MGFLELEGSRAAYRADFALYGAAVAGLALVLLVGAPGSPWPLLATAMLGYALWTVMEYLLHRFVLHGLQPFRAMHAQHHRRPKARIGTPTLVSAPLFAGLVFAPAWALAGLWPACALTLGLLTGYLVYALTHHAVHHGSGSSRWFSSCQRWHERHHQPLDAPGCYGVSLRLWDHAFGTARTGQRRSGSSSRRLG